MSRDPKWRLLDDELLEKTHDSYAELARQCWSRGEYALAHYCRKQQVSTLVELSLRAQEAKDAEDDQLVLDFFIPYR